MPEKIIIDQHEGSVEIVNVSQIHKTSIDEFFTRLQGTKVVTPMLPYGTILYTKEGLRTVYIIVKTPAFETVRYDGKEYRLAMPYRVFGIPFVNRGNIGVWVSFARSLPTEMQSQLYYAPLPNIEVSGSVCMPDLAGTSVNHLSDTEKPLGLINQFIESSYNDDITASLDYSPWNISYEGRDRSILICLLLEKWEQESEKLAREGGGPEDACHWDWVRSIRLEDLLKRCL